MFEELQLETAANNYEDENVANLFLLMVKIAKELDILSPQIHIYLLELRAFNCW